MFKKPNKKNVVAQGVTVGSAIVGGAISDGVVGLVPEEYRKWGKPAFALACAIASASTKTTSTGGQALQGAFIGMSIKQGLDALRELVLKQVPAQEGEGQLATFTNRVLGLAGSDIETPKVMLDASMFNRVSNERALAQPSNSSSDDLIA